MVRLSKKETVTITQATDYWSIGILCFSVLAFPLYKNGVFRESSTKVTDDIIADDILKRTPRLHGIISKEAVDLVVQLLQKDPMCRTTSLEGVKRCKFFQDCDWEGMEARRCKPPSLPPAIPHRPLDRGEKNTLQELVIDDFDWCDPTFNGAFTSINSSKPSMSSATSKSCQTLTPPPSEPTRKGINLEGYRQRHAQNELKRKAEGNFETDVGPKIVVVSELNNLIPEANDTNFEFAKEIVRNDDVNADADMILELFVLPDVNAQEILLPADVIVEDFVPEPDVNAEDVFADPDVNAQDDVNVDPVVVVELIDLDYQ